MMDFNILKRKFARTTGVELEIFYDVVKKVRPFWNKLLSSKRCHGRNSNLKSLEYEILLVLFYYRCYTSHFLLGMHFGHDVSNVCRHLKRMEPLMAEAIHIKKNRVLSAEDLKKHTQKIEIMVSKDGVYRKLILAVFTTLKYENPNLINDDEKCRYSQSKSVTTTIRLVRESSLSTYSQG